MDMNEFEYIMFHSMKENKYSSIEKKVFEHLDNINVVISNCQLIISNYTKEYKKTLDEKEKLFISELPKYKKLFKEEYDAANGDDIDKSSIAAHLSGIDMFTKKHQWNKAYLKTKYEEFFDLTSKSTLIYLYSILEKSLKDICEILQSEYSIRISSDKLKGDGYLQNTINYLDLIIELNMTFINSVNSGLIPYQFMRNKIVHKLAEFKTIKDIEALVSSNKDCLKLHTYGGTSKIMIYSNKFNDVFENLIKELYYEIIMAFEQKNNYKFAKRGIQHCFLILDKNIKFDSFTCIKLSKRKIQIQLKLKSRKKYINEVQCKVTLSESKKRSVNVLCQVDNRKIQQFCNFIMERNEMFYRFIFKYMIIRKSSLKIVMLVY